MRKVRKTRKPAVNMRLDMVPQKQFRAVLAEAKRRGLDVKTNAAVLRFLFWDYHRILRFAQKRGMDMETLEPIRLESGCSATGAA